MVSGGFCALGWGRLQDFFEGAVLSQILYIRHSSFCFLLLRGDSTVLHCRDATGARVGGDLVWKVTLES